MDLAALSWKLRIDELYSVLQARQRELSLQLEKTEALEQELVQQEAEQAQLELQVLQMTLRQAQLQYDLAQAKLTASETKVQSEEPDVTRMKAALQELQAKRRRLEQTVDKERKHMDQFGQLVMRHSDALGAKSADLRKQLAQAQTVMDQEASKQELPKLYDQIAVAQNRTAQLRAQHKADSQVLSAAQAKAEALLQSIAKAKAAKEEREKDEQDKAKAAHRDLQRLYQTQQTSEKRLYEVKKQEAAMMERLKQLDSQIASTKQAIIHATM
ncbi:hypothetical protein WJX72_009861 [[Myrmecia] bisecta]|uniref:Uncharacterized protein n=1 Tax=[Myrmecia] bisecta TaxID=41462 RepID=A0AAW1QSY6_9CHLO